MELHELGPRRERDCLTLRYKSGILERPGGLTRYVDVRETVSASQHERAWKERARRV